MISLQRHLAARAYQNAWANHRLLKACAALPEAEFAAARTGFFPSIRATLNQIVTVDWMYAVAILRRKGRVEEALHRLLAHAFEHQVHHRGQAHAMLAGTAVAPPQLDEFFCANEAGLRAADFAELGFSEEMVWGR